MAKGTSVRPGRRETEGHGAADGAANRPEALNRLFSRSLFETGQTSILFHSIFRRSSCVCTHLWSLPNHLNSRAFRVRQIVDLVVIRLSHSHSPEPVVRRPEPSFGWPTRGVEWFSRHGEHRSWQSASCRGTTPGCGRHACSRFRGTTRKRTAIMGKLIIPRRVQPSGQLAEPREPNRGSRTAGAEPREPNL